jgi:hypothetical protein
MLRKLIFTAFLISIFSPNIFAQQSSEKQDKAVKYNSRWGIFEKPSIEASYGLANIGREGSGIGLADAGMLELKLGFTTQRNSSYGKNVLRYMNSFSYLSYFSTDLAKRNENQGLSSQMWRFGTGKKDGLGVRIGSFSIMPYTATTIAWSRFNSTGSLTGIAAPLADFEETFRFGTTAESGLNLNVTNGVSLQAKYERSLIFPRHLFMKWAGSKIVEEGGLALLDGFTSEVLDNQPVAGTIVNFLLKSGYLYGINELRVTDMNWPFGGEAPMNYDTFKLGMTFTF